MKAISLFVCGFMLASSSVYAADKKPTNTKAPMVNQSQQSQPAKPKSDYTWQDCVDDYTKESGYSQEEAYKQCDSLQ